MTTTRCVEESPGKTLNSDSVRDVEGFLLMEPSQMFIYLPAIYCSTTTLHGVHEMFLEQIFSNFEEIHFWKIVYEPQVGNQSQ